MSDGYITPIGTGYKPFNFEQVHYQIQGQADTVIFDSVVALISVERAEALQEEILALEELMRKRAAKLTALGNILADTMKLDESLKGMTDTGTLDNAAYNKQVAKNYNVEYADSIGNDGKMSKGDAEKFRTALEKHIDLEDNDLQQNSVDINSYLSKWDEAYQTAAQFSKKTSDTRTKTVQNIR